MGELEALNAIYREDRDREDWRCALIVATILNVNRGKNDRALKPEDIMPWLLDKEAFTRGQTPEEMHAAMKQVARNMRAKQENK